MKFALNNGEKVEATKGAKGLCPSCGTELISKCGEIKVNHWAHKGSRNCDPWWENETDWHRSWKGNFPVDWQEVIHFDGSGEKHIADVKTQTGWVLEFQHSFLNPEERRSREAFYSNLVWVVDGTTRKTDKPQFEKAIGESAVIINNPHITLLRVPFPDKCRLLKEWHDSNSLVFLDLQETKDPKQSKLWFLLPKKLTTETYILPFSRQLFIEIHNQNKSDEIERDTILLINKELENGKKIGNQINGPDHTNRPSWRERYNARRRRRF